MIDEVIVIGIDHGFGDIKTRNCCFSTGIDKVPSPPIVYDNVLEYMNCCYHIGGDRLKIQESKTENDNYYILTLAAIAKELKIRGIKSGRIVLAVGLPIGRFASEKSKFINYLNKNKMIRFKYERVPYEIILDKVLVYPQCFSAIVERLPELNGLAYVVDIGSWTIDTLKVLNRTPDESGCSSSPEGVITCIHKIQDVCDEKLNCKLDEHLIKEYMMYGKVSLNQDFTDIIDNELTKYTERILRTLIENGINTKVTPIIFVGGGANLVKNYGGLIQKNISYVEDVKANACGYEILANLYLTSKGR